ncbi:MAG TPA: dihydroxy-acid dehydratase, partial [Vicinamibacterales bacterium]|nr:dihydroxy-acid dehydratase [Vicinamibacterales bacterium]
MAKKDNERGGVDPRQHSRIIVDGLTQAPSRAMLRAVGFKDEDFAKPQIGIASTWSMVTPCNMHIDGLARHAAEGADSAGGKSVLFNTITVSDGIANGTPGMRYSLVSREVIADSIETVAAAEGFDGLVTIGGCDKNMPGCVMAMARLDRPSIFVYGGTIQPGPKHRDIISVFEAVGSYAAGKIDDAELKEVESTAIPGPGSCAGMYTANTMASAIEALGLSLANSSAQEAISSAKRNDCHRAGEAVVALLKRGIKPSDILSKDSRLEEEALVSVVRVPTEPFSTFPSRFREAAAAPGNDLVFFSQVFFNSGFVVPEIESLVEAAPAR